MKMKKIKILIQSPESLFFAVTFQAQELEVNINYMPPEYICT
jgi:hypothetical protein